MVIFKSFKLVAPPNAKKLNGTAPVPSPALGRRSEAGFSLVEALIAALIFAMMMLGIMPLFIRSIQDVSRNNNQMHFNGGVQAVMDELVVRQVILPADPQLAVGWHVYKNDMAVSATTPLNISQLFLGTGATQATDKVVQNNLLGQLQYQIGGEFGRVRADVQLYYFINPTFVKPMTLVACAGVGGTCNPAAPPAHMAVVRMASYIDTPVQ